MTPPRLAPPAPGRSAIAAYRRAAKLAGIRPMPWQILAARTVTGMRGRRWAFPEAALVVARQNGKTTFLVPRIVQGLQRGERIMHTAQNRELPREVFNLVAEVVERELRGGLKSIRLPKGVAGPEAMRYESPRLKSIRLANGQEEIRMLDGGRYRIVAPTKAGARGGSNDLVIVDEVRELDSWAFIAAAKPTLTASRSPQILYLSNAGDTTSVVLNGLRARADVDPQLAYLEWSAHPDRPLDDRDGWREANPALGHTIRMEYLEGEYLSSLLGGTLAIFETEHLCRWVPSVLPRVVSAVAWDRAAAELDPPKHPTMGVAVAADGRASAVAAWIQADGTVAMTVLADVTGHPLDLDVLGKLLAARARGLYVRKIGFDPATDADLARHLGARAVGIHGPEFAAASDRFARTVDGGRLRHTDAAQVGADLAYTAKHTNTDGTWRATRSAADRPITAALAAIRAVWLATAPELHKPFVA